MGLNLLGSSTRAECGQRSEIDPDPLRFVIERVIVSGDYMLTEINYMNCTNYDGDKILLWHGIGKADIILRKEIDPHFLESNPGLIARFAPTDEGWMLGQYLMNAMGAMR